MDDSTIRNEYHLEHKFCDKNYIFNDGFDNDDNENKD